MALPDLARRTPPPPPPRSSQPPPSAEPIPPPPPWPHGTGHQGPQLDRFPGPGPTGTVPDAAMAGPPQAAAAVSHPVGEPSPAPAAPMLPLLRVAVPTAGRAPLAWLRWQVGRAPKARLLGRIEVLRSDLDEMGSVPLTSLPAEAPRRLYRALHHHNEALVLFSGGFREESWQRVQAAERELLHIADIETLVHAYHRLAAEGREKLSGWRREAFDRALGAEPLPEVDLSAPAGSAAAQTNLARRVADARLVLDEHFGNEAVRARVIGRQLRLAAFGMAAALGLYVLAVDAGWPAKLVGTDTEASVLLTSPAAVAVLALFGVLGAFLSIALTSLSAKGATKVPALEQSYSASLVRPILGAASAVTVGLLLESGLQGIVEVSSAGMIGVGIAAGFTERLLRRTVASLASTPAEESTEGRGP